MSLRFLGMTAVGLFLAMGAIGRSGWSYVKTSYNGVAEAVHDTVPLDFEIRRARTMLNDLIPEVRKNMVAIAQEEAGIEQLNAEIARQEKARDKDAADIIRLKNDLASADKKPLTYAGKTYTVEAVKMDLSRRFERRKTGDETLANLHKMQAAREQSLRAAHDKMNGMIAAKKQLEVEIEQLDSRLKMVEAAQTTSNLCLDEGRLSQTKQLIASLKARLDVNERLVNAEIRPLDEIPVGEVAAQDIVEQVTAYFDGPKPTKTEVAVIDLDADAAPAAAANSVSAKTAKR
jgi:chromosome segregation ATPase